MPADPMQPAAAPGDHRSRPGTTPEGRHRDRTGQPLPHGTPEPVGGFALEHDVDFVEEALVLAVQRWDVGRYFEAHELLEHVWHHAPDEDRLFWQGIIQVAVAHVLWQRGRADGVARTRDKARPKFDGVPDGHHGVDVPALLALLDRAVDGSAGGVVAEEPAFPALDGGPWFARPGERDEPASWTPLSREPPWMVASRERADRRAGD